MNFGDFRNCVLDHARPGQGTWVYRGQRDPEWPLVTSYARFLKEARADFDLESFSKMLDLFIKRASEADSCDYSTRSYPQQAALAQHHGVPTPFLDWSYSPFVATYFAIAAKRDSEAFAVHALQVDGDPPLRSNKADGDPREIGSGCVAFVDTNRFFSRRIIHQQGCFTFQNFGDDLGGRVDSSLYRKFSVQGDLEEIRRELTLMGLTPANLFDDLDHLGNDVLEGERAELLQANR